MKQRTNVGMEELSLYFNIPRRTINYHKSNYGFDYIKLYNKFEKSKTIREKKNSLYNLKEKYDEDMLDFIWENFVERIEHEINIERFKTNKRINKEIL
jgi:hypothetical protein